MEIQQQIVNGQQNSDSLISRVLTFIKERKDRVERGEINCIPSPFKRFNQDFVGIEQGNYYLISGATKSAKSKITNFLFIYSTIFYAIENPDKVSLKIFYDPLEETPEAITLGYMSYLLFILSDRKVRISPSDLKSTDSSRPLSDEILELLHSDKYKKYMEYFEECITFITERNPTGIYKVLKNYAENNGTTHYKTIEFTNKETGELEHRRMFNYYVPNNPKEYVIILVDHVSLLENEKGLDLRQSINKLSEYMIMFRNRYNYIPVIVQQQSTESTNLEAYKAGKIRPTMAGLSDSKYTGKDCSLMFGITNPYSFEIPEYLGYDITRFKGNIRFLEIVLNRNGVSNGICPLYFDGATNFFSEVPLPSDKVGLEKVYRYLDTIRSIKGKVFMLISNIKQKWQIV